MPLPPLANLSFDKNGKMAIDSQTKATNAYDNTRNAIEEVTSALQRQNAELEKTIAAEEKANELTARKKALQDKANRVDSEGFQVNNAGERLVFNTPTERSVYEKAKSQGLNEDQSLKIVQDFLRNGQMINWQSESASGGNWYTALQKGIDKIVLDNAKKTADAKPETADKSFGAAPDTSTRARGPATATSTSHIVTLNIGGQNTPINVASESDARALIGALKRAQQTAG